MVFAFAESLDGGSKIVVLLAAGGSAGGEVGAQFVGGAVAVGVLTNDGVLCKPGRFGAGLLLVRRAAKYQHAGRDHVLWQVQGFPHLLGVLDDIADVAAADAQAFRRHHGILRRDAGIGHGQQQVSCTGDSYILDARCLIGLQPTAAIGQKHQHQRCLGNERLVVAQIGQAGFQRRVGDVQNRVQLLVARRGCLERRL